MKGISSNPTESNDDTPETMAENTLRREYEARLSTMVKAVVGLSIFTTACLVGAIILTIVYTGAMEKMTGLERRLENSAEVRQDQIETIIRMTDKIKLQDMQLKKYEELKGIFDELEGRHVKDMTSYIQERYTQVPTELAELIAKTTHEKCVEHGVDFGVIVGIMEVESHFNPFAISHKGARGLLQVMPSVWLEPLGIEDKTDLHDISTGIDAGIRIYLEYLDQEDGNIKRALNRYNGCDLEKGPYAPKVFEALGRFTAYRNNSYPGGSVNGDEGKTEKENNG